jgi:hypothetical protein
MKMPAKLTPDISVAPDAQEDFLVHVRVDRVDYQQHQDYENYGSGYPGYRHDIICDL